MPIFMDRHDVSESVSAELLAEIHQEDLKIEHEYGCRGFTYWFDSKRKNAFCLIEAPNKEAITRMHKHAHGDVPNTIIEVESNIVESFLGRITDPEKTRNTPLNIINDSAYRVLMFINITNSQDNLVNITLKTKEIDEAIINLLKAQNGNIVKKDNSSYLVSFKSVTNAISSAVKIELEIKPKLNEFFKTLKVGIASGEPVTNKSQIFEETISLINRMCDIIHGEIVVSYEVKTLYESEQHLPISKHKYIRVLNPAQEKFLIHLMDEVEISWQNPEFNLDTFSENLGYSKSQLYRKIKGLTNKSPNTFIRDYRLNRALKLMNNQHGNISEIAFETGFNSLAYFSKCFKAKYHTLPSKYNQAQKPSIY
ncbi:nickel-binding protein [Aestuariibaculum suncheonense]|uniref:DUF4242 domain-containing protein n=1 Tax=Aestuariibaculum suncheonense TaxID=1028745 RepID=A0A8J6UAE4_9FLAO|nr:nickel-binding protein [Aestuariibaculum suncheonense]MBD0834272.1 DUF4242 domain-containing protein [Aestuariibaculum suncheonense]